MATEIRDAVEAVLLTGVKAWGLEISPEEVRDGVRCLEDRELLAAADCLNVPGDVLSTLPSLLEQHPGILDDEETSRSFATYQEQMETVVKETSEALDRLQPLLGDEVDPDYFSSVLGTLAFLAMRSCCSEAWRVCEALGFSGESIEGPLAEYAGAVAAGGWQVIKKAHARILVTDLGQVIDRIIRRQARRTFTLLAVGDRSAVTMALAQIFTEIMKEADDVDSRSDCGKHESHEEQAR